MNRLQTHPPLPGRFHPRCSTRADPAARRAPVAALRLLVAALLLPASDLVAADPVPLWQLDAKAALRTGPVAGLPSSARHPIVADPAGLADASTVALTLPDGRSVTLRSGPAHRHGNGDSSVRVHSDAKSPIPAAGVLTAGASGLFGRLRVNGRLLLVHSDVSGAWLIDASRPELIVDDFGSDVLTPTLDAAAHGRVRSEARVRAAATESTDRADDPPRGQATVRSGEATVIDVMFIYPDAMQARYPGDLLETRLNHLVAIANQALADSGVPAVVRKVLQRPVGSLPTDNNSEMLGLLSDAVDGTFVPGLENLAAIRDQVGADLVVLTWPHDIETRGSCGIAFFPRPADDPDPRYGVHITNDGVSNWSICSDAVFTHELGHNLNARHQQFPGDDPSLSNYAYVQLGRFNTVMGSFGTGDPNRFLRLDRFSSPDLQCGGGPCGSEIDGERADNAAELRRRIGQVAAYRGGTSTAPAPDPVDADSDGDGVPDSTDPYPLDPLDGQAPAPPPPPTFAGRALRAMGSIDDYELLVVDSALDQVLAFNLDGSARGTAAAPQAVDDLPVLTEFSDLAVDGTGLAWLLASADVRRYDRATGALVDVFLDSERPEPRELLSAFPRALGFDPAGGLVVLGDNAVERYDETGRRRAEPQPGDSTNPADWNTLMSLPLRAFAFGPEGHFYLAEGGQGRILVFDGTSGERLQSLAFGGQLSDPRDMGFGPDGLLYVADGARVVRFDPNLPGVPEILVPPGRGGLASARALAFGPAGDLFVVDRDRGGVLRFDAATGAYLDDAVAPGQLQAAEAIAIAPKLRAVRPGHSGHWFDPDRSGEGWLVEVLPDGRAAVLWFTYPAEGESDEQLWLTGAGTVQDDAIVIPDLLRARGGRFGPGFDPADIELSSWGALTLRFDDCRRGTAEWAGANGYGSGSRAMQRLAGIEGLPCEEAPRPAAAERPGLSGQWYDPAQDGQGWLLQEVRPGELFLAWFTYDRDGIPAWIVGGGTLDGAVATFDDLLITRGTRFGDAFDAAEVDRLSWGQATWVFETCTSSSIEWTSDDPGFSSGQLEPVRLTRLDALDCSVPSAD
ncbi:M12 family metallo-peptidase [Halomonas denitrificans]|nr:hypothetical protein [Halomonas denitrificans]